MNVSVRTSAREDILRQYFYYAVEKDTEPAADRFLASVQSAIEFLCRMPDAGAPRLLDNQALLGLRAWPVTGFSAIRIYYIHSGEDLLIVRVLHGKRDIGPLLEGEADDEN